MKRNGGSEWESNPPATGKPAARRFLKITRDVLMGYESFLFYMISQPLTRRGILIGSEVAPF